MAIAGEDPGFVEVDDESTISIKPDHPAKKLLLEALVALDRDHIRVAVECMEDAMTAISVRDSLMVEF